MALTREQVVKLYIAGTVPLPTSYPEYGQITLVAAGHEIIWDPGQSNRKATDRRFLRIEQRATSATTAGYEVALEDVEAIFWKPDDAMYDPWRDWWLRPEIGGRLSDAEINRLNPDGPGRSGIVYVKEGVGILTTSAISAGQVISMPESCA